MKESPDKSTVLLTLPHPASHIHPDLQDVDRTFSLTENSNFATNNRLGRRFLSLHHFPFAAVEIIQTTRRGVVC